MKCKLFLGTSFAFVVIILMYCQWLETSDLAQAFETAEVSAGQSEDKRPHNRPSDIWYSLCGDIRFNKTPLAACCKDVRAAELNFSGNGSHGSVGKDITVRGRIPCTIHQTWKTNHFHELDLHQQASVCSWKMHNPDCEHRLWSDAEMHNFIKTHYYHDLWPIWTDLNKIQQTDLFRYALIFKFGGIYSDIDVVCLKRIQSWGLTNDTTAVIGYEHLKPLDEAKRKRFTFSRSEQFLQWTFGAEPRHPILKRCLQLVNMRLDWGVNDTLELTGPAVFTDAVREFLLQASLAENRYHRKAKITQAGRCANSQSFCFAPGENPGHVLLLSGKRFASNTILGGALTGLSLISHGGEGTWKPLGWEHRKPDKNKTADASTNDRDTSFDVHLEKLSELCKDILTVQASDQSPQACVEELCKDARRAGITTFSGIESHGYSSKAMAGDSQIPCIIHQLQTTNKLNGPDLYQQASTCSWKKKNPSCEIRVWSDAEMDSFIAMNLQDDLWPTWTDLNKVQQADVFCYAVIYKFGGVFSDMDAVPLKPITSWGLNNDTTAVVGYAQGSYKLRRNKQFEARIFGAKPGHPLLKRYLQLVHMRMDWGIKNTEELTGPAIFSDAIYEFLLGASRVNASHHLGSSGFTKAGHCVNSSSLCSPAHVLLLSSQEVQTLLWFRERTYNQERDDVQISWMGL